MSSLLRPLSMAMATTGAGGKGEVMAVCEGDEVSDAFPANFAEVVASLPQGPRCPLFPSIRLYRGFWLAEFPLLALPQIHARFKPRPTDILLASFPKSGTTWLKSLCYAAARRAVHPPSGGDHPLLRSNPHDCVKSLDSLRFLQGDDAEAPRLLSTHLPCSLLPDRATADGGAGCRIVYVYRDPKDTLVSLWHFNFGVKADDKDAQPPAAGGSFEEAFELYCQGCYGMGPQWEHAREYWEASKRRPDHVLCLRYEEMLRDPAGSLRKVAAFMGCPFSAAEEEAGVVRDILELCSMEKQRSLAVNKDGDYVIKGLLTIGNKHFFRKGVAGDWRNHMTPEMAARLDAVVEEALEGSGFTFRNAE